LRGSPLGWLKPLPAIALIVSLAACSLSLRGAAGPGGTFGTPTPAIAAGQPTVAIAAPATGTSAAVGQIIAVDVRAADPYPVGVARLELFAGDTLVDRVLAAGGAARRTFGAILEWMPQGPGSYVLSAYAYRADGTASAPASVVVIVTGEPLPSSSGVALPSVSPSGLPSPSVLPTGSEIPTVTLSPSPPATPRPTPSPTPAPIGVHIDVWVEPAELPAFTVGVKSTFVVHVQNIGANAISYVRLVAVLTGSEDKARTGPLAPGQATTISMSVTPTQDDIHQLFVIGKLPAGYFDTDPNSNTLNWQYSVFVAAGATPPPSPSPSPSPGP
jgi:hypothetical protein